MGIKQEFDARQFTLSFAEEMNAWESAFEKEWSAHIDIYVHGAPESAMAAYRANDELIKTRFRRLYAEIFSRYCTEKDRKHGGPTGPLSAGVPTKFDGSNHVSGGDEDLESHRGDF